MVEDDQEFTESSLSLTTLKAGGNQNKHSLSLEPKLGRIRLRKWDNLHFRGSPKHPMTLILVERLDATGQLKTQPLWRRWGRSPNATSYKNLATIPAPFYDRALVSLRQTALLD